ncbi:NADP-dependent oxidoreductase domain-containing protein [Stachybotrys elegans]|uniref:NADP-dependent oxidoreductase domain-containing protein n=1 Tax=Stachybotrys elegans TaxID=80388 RepID=A0A8K0WUY7_9HYPO|nr:NADP-dependent oxidoreductase domain-containing protein [Stachybotrys elegans]
MSISVALPLAPPAKSPLARYRLLSPTASIRVSPLCLGGMSFGDAWKDLMGSCDQATTESILDYYYSQGGNFIDTSCNYQRQQSERWIGEWMKKRGVRDEMVIATKFTINFHAGLGHQEIIANFQGNGPKSLRLAVNGSLAKLQTDYIDILYVHWFDFSSSIPALMQSLNHLIASGKVLTLGISDAPAWVVAKCNEYARNNGLQQFSIYQGRWNASRRDFEREIIPMCRAEGMGILPWGVLGSGAFKTEAQRQKETENREGRDVSPRDQDIAVSKVLEEIGRRKGTSLTAIAQAYVAAKVPYVVPIIGCRKVEHLKGSIEALTIHLTDDEIEEIEATTPFDPGFPNDFMYGPKIPKTVQDVWILRMGGEFDYVPETKSLTRD